jgi:hypothetical protein
LVVDFLICFPILNLYNVLVIGLSLILFSLT